MNYHTINDDGYLLIPGAIGKSEVDDLLAEVKRLVKVSGDEGNIYHEDYYHKASYKLPRILRLTKKFDYLIDHEGYIDALISLIGTHLQLMGTEIFVRGPANEMITGFHTDSGPGMQRLLPLGGVPFLQLKAQIFLTDLSEPDSGNFALIPGSHVKEPPDKNDLCMIESLNNGIKSGGFPGSAIQICAKPGDVLLFPHTLWHAVAPNASNRTRYSISLRYGQIALRPLERFDPILNETDRILSARQRRLLGDFGEKTKSPYRPVDQNSIILNNVSV